MCTRHSARSDAASGYAELDHPDPAARLDHAGELAHRRRAVVDVAQQIGERQRVELGVGERQLLGLAADEPHPTGERGVGGQPRSRTGEHVLALVEADDLAAAAVGQREGDQPGPGGDVEHALPGTCGSIGVDQRPAPARVLAEAEHRPHPVILARASPANSSSAWRLRGDDELSADTDTAAQAYDPEASGSISRHRATVPRRRR